MSFLKTSTIKITAIIGLMGILSSVATGSANAGNYGVNLHLGNGTGIYFNGNSNHHHKKAHRRHNNNPGYYDPRYQPRRNHQRHHNNYRAQQRNHVCGPRRAVNKAYRLGLNNPQVHRIKENRIVVSGHQYGYRTKMVFKRYSKCHLIKTVNKSW